MLFTEKELWTTGLIGQILGSEANSEPFIQTEFRITDCGEDSENNENSAMLNVHGRVDEGQVNCITYLNLLIKIYSLYEQIR